jgi:predicted DsbA family dithiol-disulfide isomerase
MSLRVPVLYDLASTLCYVAHRTLPRLAEPLGELEIELVWRPLDLARLLGWRRGAPVSGRRRNNALAVAEEFDIRVRMPSTWLDSRRAMAFGLAQSDPAVAASWRERVFSAVFEEGRPIERDEDLAPLARELGLRLEASAIETGLAELARLTEEARDAEVTGVPTFKLGAWPLGGIQSDETMLAILGRWARKQRRAL